MTGPTTSTTINQEKTMTMFVRLRENNDWEGETWNFWLQVDGNEAALEKLAGLLAPLRDVEPVPYELLTDSREPESVVDTLVKHSDVGYMHTHNKIVGAFTCPDSLGEDGDALYKGGIKDFFRADGA